VLVCLQYDEHQDNAQRQDGLLVRGERYLPDDDQLLFFKIQLELEEDFGKSIRHFHPPQ
jgi:hypothetical protein